MYALDCDLFDPAKGHFPIQWNPATQVLQCRAAHNWLSAQLSPNQQLYLMNCVQVPILGTYKFIC